jgi:HD-GYP domain-containing protein (c-di-GMP phosphodiesterase class II)
VALHNASLKETQANFFTHVTQILVHALDTHVEHQQGHVKRVAFYSNQIGRDRGLSEAQLERLYFAALLHDVGMLKLAGGSGSDMDRLRKHAILGFEMISPITLWSDVAPMILHHQEWHNGDGFPEGLAGEQIPLESRIIAVADALDTMTAESSHRVRIDLSAALDELRRRAGTQFDPELVFALVQSCERGDIKL